MKQFALSIRPAAAILGIGLLSCSGDLTLPNSTAAGLKVAVTHGDGQVGTVGQTLPEAVMVQVLTETDVPIAGRKVAFVASAGQGTEGFQPDTAVTNDQGEALTHWVLGTVPGVYTAEARIVAEGDSVVPAAALQAEAKPGAPDSLNPAGPTYQPGRRNQPLAEPLVVIAVDRFGNPVADVQVEWKTGSGGQLSQELAPTGADGKSSVTWTLGDRIGVQKATAKVDGAIGSPVTFTATVLF